MRKLLLNNLLNKQSTISSAKVETEIFDALDQKVTGNHKGHNFISHLTDQINEPKDLWLAYEVGGNSLSKMLFDVKGEFHNGERIYFVNHQDFYYDVKNNKMLLRQFLLKLMLAFDLLQSQGIVHADIKSDNILVSYNKDEITNVKLIDFGSAFLFERANCITMSTPEYLAPEILDYLDGKGKTKYTDGAVGLFKTMHVWSYDMWSIGAMLLEIISGFPLWLSLKSRMKSLKGK